MAGDSQAANLHRMASIRLILETAIGAQMMTLANTRRRAPRAPERPWLKRKRDETAQEWNRRTNHSCYACGDYYTDLIELDAHETAHRRVARLPSN